MTCAAVRSAALAARLRPRPGVPAPALADRPPLLSQGVGLGGRLAAGTVTSHLKGQMNTSITLWLGKHTEFDSLTVFQQHLSQEEEKGLFLHIS